MGLVRSLRYLPSPSSSEYHTNVLSLSPTHRSIESSRDISAPQNAVLLSALSLKQGNSALYLDIQNWPEPALTSVSAASHAWPLII
jgi:hypothetical protein